MVSWLNTLQEVAKVGDEYCIRMIPHTDQVNHVVVGQRGGSVLLYT